MTEDLVNLLVSLTIAAIGITGLVMIAERRRRWRDPLRLFSGQQKRELLVRAGDRCEHKSPLWRRCRQTRWLEADHIRPWALGGRTELWNGQILCHRHNRRKAARFTTPIYRWRLERRRREYRT